MGVRSCGSSCLLRRFLVVSDRVSESKKNWRRKRETPKDNTGVLGKCFGRTTPLNVLPRQSRWGTQRGSCGQKRPRPLHCNCLSCRNPFQTPHSLNCLPPFTDKRLKPFFSLRSASSHPLSKKLGSDKHFGGCCSVSSNYLKGGEMGNTQA